MAKKKVSEKKDFARYRLKESEKGFYHRACSGKKAYGSASAASSLGQSSYKCPFCHKWHAAGVGQIRQIMSKFRKRESRKKNRA